MTEQNTVTDNYPLDDAQRAGRPRFTIVVTTYNRRDIVQRCVESCLRQTEPAEQIVVVDDCSTDDTAVIVRERWPDEVDLVVREANGGISPARHTGTAHARGDWVVVVDSDWELFPTALEELRQVIEELPAGVRVIQARLQWDNGRVSPAFMPSGIVDYDERLKFVESEGGFDSLHCIERTVFEEVPYVPDRRGMLDELYELDLASATQGVYCDGVLGKQYFDAPNSYLRSVQPAVLVPRLVNDAPDYLWMAETTLERHGGALRAYGPTQFMLMLRVAGSKAFLSGDRRKGLRYTRRYLRRKPSDPVAWLTLVAGLAGPRALAYCTLWFRVLTAPEQ